MWYAGHDFRFQFQRGAPHNSLGMRSLVRVDVDLFDNMEFRMIMDGFEA